MLGLIRCYLNAGILANGVAVERHEGTPQGGPLSPLLANVLLDDVDKELEKRGHAFVRYADDCNVYVRSKRAGERVMGLLRRLYERLRLRVNESKSAVDLAWNRKLLGYSFWVAPGRMTKRRVAGKALAAMKERVRIITRRTRGRSIVQVVQELRSYLVGWKEYFRLADTPGIFANLDQWIRHRLRAIHQALEARAHHLSGAAQPRPLGCGRPPGGGQRPALVEKLRDAHQRGLSHPLLRRAGGASARRVTPTFRAARCAPACRVVWEGSPRKTLGDPIPIGASMTQH